MTTRIPKLPLGHVSVSFAGIPKLPTLPVRPPELSNVHKLRYSKAWIKAWEAHDLALEVSGSHEQADAVFQASLEYYRKQT